jgi:Domain of unknown function DUF29
MATQVKPTAARLYEDDFYVWTQRQAEALRGRRLEELDLEHLAEEVEDLGSALRSALRSRTRTIIEHLLKLEFSPAEEPKRGWRQTIRTQRRDLADDITPTLRQDLLIELPELYERTRTDLAEDLREYGEHAAADALPVACPYTLERILEPWLPPAP